MEKIILGLLQGLVKMYGKKVVKQAVDSLEDGSSTQGVPPKDCPKGQIYNPLLGKCVDELG